MPYRKLTLNKQYVPRSRVTTYYKVITLQKCNSRSKVDLLISKDVHLSSMKGEVVKAVKFFF